MVTMQREAVRRSDLSGSERRTALSCATDDWLVEIFDNALTTFEIDPTTVCLAATGSYARRELSERSDLDLVLLHTSIHSIDVLAEAVWYPIWDARVSMDHSVRTPAETRLTAHSDIRVALGAMDMRAIAGNGDLVEATRGSVLADWRAQALRRAPELRALVAARRERAGDLAQRIEPDLKDSYGGIREATVIRALASSWLVDIPHVSWDESLSLLLDVRDVLHRQGLGDRLVRQTQDDVAAAMELPDADSLLRSVYLAARQIAYVSDQAWLRLERLERRSTTHRGIQGPPRRTPIANGLVISDGEIHIARDIDVSCDPGLVLRAAAASAQHHHPLAEATVTRLAEEAVFPESWSPEMLGSFVSLIGAGPAMADVIEALDQAGILIRVIPEWETIRSAPQRDPVHTFTVDRHLVMTAVHSSQYTRDVHRPDLLLIGSFFHDIGKARGGDHSIVGAELAPGMCARMGLDEHDTAVITAMIRWHLLLPDTAFRYDITDPSTWRRVREHVPDTETLELLLYLALADQKATGPSVATEWREQLLRQLVAHVSAGVETEEAIPEPSIDQQEVLGVPGVVVTSRPEADGLLVTVGAPDRVGLLSIVAGVLAAHRLEIRSARVVTVGDSAAQDWHVRPFFGDAPDPGLIAEDIRRVLEGSSHLDDWLARRSTPERRADAAPPRVLISHSPDTHTRLEIRAHDEPGLLHRVARIISEHGSVIRGAIVTTAGSEVVDSFFVVDASGRPLEPGQAQLLADAITSGLRAPPASASA
jgi:[protein-PII] uridylyltransferase